MKIIGIFLGNPALPKFLHSSQYYRQGYIELNEAISKHGTMVLLSTQDTYLGNGIFNKHWFFENGELVEGAEISIDVLYNKSHFVTDGTIPVFNPQYIDEVCTNKDKTYQLFKHLCPATFTVHNEKELYLALFQIPSSQVVTKPIDGGEGKGVAITPREFLSQLPLSYPVLIQEFLDTSAGIPGIMTGIHDLRIAILNGEIIYSFYRTPPPGKLISNFALGGTIGSVPIATIPETALQVVREVDAHFQMFPSRYYGIDVAFTEHGVKIIELNAHLGLSLYEEGEEYRTLNEKLAATLAEFQG